MSKSNESPAPSEAPAKAPKSAAPAAVPSPLADKLASAKSTVARMAGEVKNQLHRHQEIARLGDERAKILSDVEHNRVGFDDGRKALSDAAAGVELHMHTASRRADQVAAEYSLARLELVRLRVIAVGVVKRCCMTIIEKRQADAREFLAKMGGTVAPDAWPLAVNDILAADAVLRALEDARTRLDRWEPSTPARVLIEAAEAALSLITEHGLVEAVVVGADETEAGLSHPYGAVGWWPSRPGFDVVGVFADKQAADDFIARANLASSFAGARRLAVVGGHATPITRFASSRNAIIGQESHDRNWMRTQGFSDFGESYLSTAAAFLAPA